MPLRKDSFRRGFLLAVAPAKGLPSRDVPLAFRALDRIPCGRFFVFKRCIGTSCINDAKFPKHPLKSYSMLSVNSWFSELFCRFLAGFLGLWSIFAGFSEFLSVESDVVLSYFVEPANHRKSPKDNPKGFRQKTTKAGYSRQEPAKVCKEISEKH